MWLTARERWIRGFDAAVRAMPHRIEMRQLEEGDIQKILDWCRETCEEPWGENTPVARWLGIPYSDRTRRPDERYRITLYFRSRGDANFFQLAWKANGRSVLIYEDRTKMRV